jgi:hypothetical protein
MTVARGLIRMALALWPAAALASQAAPPPDPPDSPWDAHAAAAVLDASFETSEACEASLSRARAAESTPAADIDPRLRDLFTHARCTLVVTPQGPSYGLRLHWPRAQDAAG